MSDFLPDSGFINRPAHDPKKMEAQLEELRSRVTTKMNTWANRIVVSMSHTPQVPRREGERWTEDGRTYEMINGIKTSISALQSARMPFWCPRCSKSMTHRFDRKFYYMRGWCYNCNIDIEHQMRLDGTWEPFERYMIRQNQKARIRDEIDQRLQFLKDFNGIENHFSDGRFEILATREEFEPILAEVEADVERLLEILEGIVKAEQEEENASTPITPKDVAARLDGTRE